MKPIRTLLVTILVIQSGCVTYRDVTIRVIDGTSDTPIADALVEVNMVPILARFNAERYPTYQQGVSSADGIWHTTVARIYGHVSAEATGYSRSRWYDLWPDLLDRGEVVVVMCRCAPESPEEANRRDHDLAR